MADKRKEEKEKQTPPPLEPAERLFSWIEQKKRPLTLGIGAIAIVGGSAWFMMSAQTRREAFASRELQQARIAAESGNLQLAASDLGRVVSQYGNTRPGADATVLLARVRLQQGDAQTAVTELQAFLNTGPDDDFRSPAAGLLGAALEDLGQYEEASRAFETAADASDYSHLRAQLLVDAARNAGLSGNVPRAVSLYDQVLDEDEDSPVASEALLRKAELEGSTQPG